MLNADIIYKNQTNHLIKYFYYDSTDGFLQFAFELDSGFEKRYEVRGDGGNKNETIFSCCLGVFL